MEATLLLKLTVFPFFWFTVSEFKVTNENGCGKRKWIRTSVNVENHVVVPNLGTEIESPDQFVEDYISHMTTTPLDLSKPLWELHLLNVKTSYAEALGVFRIHHSLGDGASLMSLLLACTRKTSDPEALPTVPTIKRAGASHSSRFWWLLLAIWSALLLVWNTFVDVLTFTATSLFLKDTKSPIKGAPGVELTTKRFVHRTVSLDDIKLIKNATQTVRGLVNWLPTLIHRIRWNNLAAFVCSWSSKEVVIILISKTRKLFGWHNERRGSVSFTVYSFLPSIRSGGKSEK